MFFHFKKNLYPLIAIASGMAILIVGLLLAGSIYCTYFLIGVFFWLMIFGNYKMCLHILPLVLVIGGVFFGISYAASGSLNSGVSMANRIAAVLIAIVPGMSIQPIALTRSLSQVHTPRAVTLGMLIAISFMPTLGSEIKRVREAMKTRGAGSILNPKILYRAFLVPLVMRLVNISDTLALSVETRGFEVGKVKYSIYKKEYIALSDIIFLLGLTAAIVLAVIL